LEPLLSRCRNKWLERLEIGIIRLNFVNKTLNIVFYAESGPCLLDGLLNCGRSNALSKFLTDTFLKSLGCSLEVSGFKLFDPSCLIFHYWSGWLNWLSGLSPFGLQCLQLLVHCIQCLSHRHSVNLWLGRLLGGRRSLHNWCHNRLGCNDWRCWLSWLNWFGYWLCVESIINRLAFLHGTTKDWLLVFDNWGNWCLWCRSYLLGIFRPRRINY
jgi:hypothetical protein